MAKGYTVFRKLSKDDVENVCLLYLNNFSLSSIGRTYGVDHSSIVYQLKKRGLYLSDRKIGMRGVDLDSYSKEEKIQKMKKGSVKENKIVVKKRTRRFYKWQDNEKEFPKSYKEYAKKRGVKIPSFIRHPNTETNEYRRRSKTEIG